MPVYPGSYDLRHEAISRFLEIALTTPEVASISSHREPRMLFRNSHATCQRVLEVIDRAPPSDRDCIWSSLHHPQSRRPRDHKDLSRHHPRREAPLLWLRLCATNGYCGRCPGAQAGCISVSVKIKLLTAMTPSPPTAAYTSAPANTPAMGVHNWPTMGELYHRRTMWLQELEQIGNALKRGCLGTNRQAEQQHDGTAG